MKKFLYIQMMLLLSITISSAQNVGIGTNNPNPSAALEIAATNQGLLIPRTDTSNIANPVVGLMIFQTSDNGFYFHNGSNWQILGRVPELSDADADTKIVVEQSPDEDVIRFLVEGVEYLSLSNKSMLLEYPGYSTFIGRFAGQSDDGSNNSNVFIGRSSGGSNTSGANNMFIGNYSGAFNSTGSNNVNIGLSAGNQKNSSFNTNIGTSAGQSAGGGSNTNIGFNAGRFNTGSSNTMIGYSAGYSNTGSGNLFLGYNAGRNLVGSDLLAIANSSTNTPLILGDFADEELIFNGSVEVVNEDISISGLASNNTNKGLKFVESNFAFMGITYEGSSGYGKKIHFRNYDQGSYQNAMTVTYNGTVGIGEDSPTHKLEVKGFSSSGHIMKIENSSINNEADGLEIKLAPQATDVGNNFITFTNGTGTAGRIEGFNLVSGPHFTDFPGLDLSTYINLGYINAAFDPGSLPALCGSPPSLSGSFPTISTGSATINLQNLFDCTNPTVCPPSALPPFLPTCSDCQNIINYTGPSLSGPWPTINPGNLNICGAQLPSLDWTVLWQPQLLSSGWNDVRGIMKWAAENGVEALSYSPFDRAMLADPDYWSNLATAKDGGVTYGSKGADYAEWLERTNHETSMQGGQIVAVKNGKISLNTEDADQLMVISMMPIVLGNMPDSTLEKNYEKVSFIGQAPTWVVGEVKSGDYIIPSGQHDGYGLAISPDEITLDQVSKIVGRAWQDADEIVNLVNMAVGLKTNEMAIIMQNFQGDFDKLESRVDKIEQLLDLSAQK